MNISQQLAEHLVAVTENSFTPTVISRAKTRLLDAAGNIILGKRGHGSDAFAQVVIGWGGAQQSSVFGYGVKLPAHNAAMVNAMLMRSFDFESVGAESVQESMKAAHISGTTIPVALAMGERLQASGREVLTALLVGDDVASRLAVASGFHTASGGDNTGTVNALGSVAICGKLMGFTAGQYVDGMGIALNQIAGTVANLFDLADSFKLPQANSARNGIFSAELAAAGFTGLIDPIGGKFGFFDLYSPAPDPSQLTEQLGVLFTADMIIKPWSSCRAAHPSLDAAIRLATENDLDPAQITAVRVIVTPTMKKGFTGQEFRPERNPEVAGLFSIRYNVAVGLIHRDFFPEHLQPEIMYSSQVQEMLGKIELVDSLPPHEYQTAELEVDLADGRTLHIRTDVPKGDIYRTALTDDEVKEKFERNVAFGGGVPADRVGRIIEVVDRFDQLDDVTELTALLA